MALTKCSECGKEVSNKAEKCPNCGAPTKKKTSFLSGCLTVIAIFWAIGYFANTSEKTNSSKTSTSSLTPGYSGYQNNKDNEIIYANQLEVKSWKCEKEYSYIFVTGEVKNVSSEKIENVVAVGEFRTKDGVFVKSEDALIDYNPILPGQSSPFKAGGTDNPEIKNCNISFKTLFGKSIGFTIANGSNKSNNKKH